MLSPPPRRKPSGHPVIGTLPAGSVLRRVHGSHAADEFNWTAQPTVLTGGRFDSLDGAFGYAYLAETASGAIAETVCRDLPLGGAGRQVPRAVLAGRVITSVELVRDLRVLELHGADLTQVHAPLDLTKCDAGQFVTTRRWAAALRTWMPDVDGFRYRCRHDEDELAVVLFDDPAPRERAHEALVALSDSLALDSLAGLALVLSVLHRHNASMA